uniref:hypothetical protein n=1 Tax=Wolbachia endosymbiont (group A) of Icerya purchasi TaxID=2954019 RepID=UPI00222F0A60|nr:hypothetical protein [Wolbachia endosymbiont (group A) of Icerya purchasi]
MRTFVFVEHNKSQCQLLASTTQLYEHCNLQAICVADGVIPVLDTGIQPFHNHQNVVF